MNQAILKSLYSGISNSYERHSKYRYPEKCVCLFQRCKHFLTLTYSTRDSYIRMYYMLVELFTLTFSKVYNFIIYDY